MLMTNFFVSSMKRSVGKEENMKISKKSSS